ncbi:TPA: terminase large subunit, partial [Escherichia coli]|nr:terminase large subunit [Escherichia coli]
EYHEHDTDHMYEAMTMGMGARSQPLTLIITTAGSSLESPCYDKDKEVKEVIEGITRNDRLFGMIYELDAGDDWTDPKNLIKANPNLDVSVKYSDLVELLEVAKQVPRKVNAFKTKRLNIWVSGKSAFYNMEQWKAAEDPDLELADFANDSCNIGLDLAKKLDMNAGIRLFTREIEGKRHYYCIKPKFWVPEDTIHTTDPKLLKTADRYQKFYEMGVLEATDGAEADYREILASIIDMQDENRIDEIDIDPAGATALRHQLEDNGFTVVDIRQDYTNMSPAMKELEAALAGGRFHHDGNPILTWCISNVIGKFIPGSDDLVRPTKGDNQSKIDGATALFNAMTRAMLHESSGGTSVYDEEDIAC